MRQFIRKYKDDITIVTGILTALLTAIMLIVML